MNENASETVKPSPLITWGILVLLAFVWGSSFILMKKAMFEEDGGTIFSEMQVAAMRIFIAFLFLIPFVWKDLREVVGKKAWFLLAVGLFGNGIPAFLFTASLQELDSSYVGMLNALVPLFTLIIALLIYKVKMHLMQVIGIIIGLGGALGLIFYRGVDTKGDLLLYSSLVIAATICYAISVNIIRNNLHEIKPTVITGIAFIYIGPATGIYLLASDAGQVIQNHPDAWAAIGYTSILAIGGTALAVILFNRLIKMTSGIFAASVTYMIPIVAIFWGVIDGEAVHPIQIVWSVVILAGVWLVNKKKAASK